jgi:hypothetical protein
MKVASLFYIFAAMEILIEDVSEYLHYYTKEEILHISKHLSIILKKYNDRLLTPLDTLQLPDRLLDMLKLVLSLTEHYELNYRQSNLNHTSYRPVSQLQELKHALTRIKDRHINIAFKLPRKTLLIDNEVVSQWIRQQLLKAYHEFDLTMEDFGDAMFLLDSNGNRLYDEHSADELRKYAERPMSFSKLIYSFCNGIIEFLKATFELLPHDATYLSEQQLSFLYELLCLMDFEGFQEEFSTDEYPSSLDIDRLYQLLNKQRRLSR